MLYFPLHPLIIFVVDKAFGTGGISKKMGDVPYEKREKNAFFISMFVIVLILVYSIFLLLNLGTLWFYAGLITYLVGLVMFLTAILNIATTPVGQPFTKGLYCFSRHPMLFSGAITLVGVSMASASWVFLLLSIVYIALQNSEAIAEERGCLKIYGDEY
jgi:protein-S-isoprenylcysteine O-methyltransferase Ste14